MRDLAGGSWRLYTYAAVLIGALGAVATISQFASLASILAGIVVSESAPAPLIGTGLYLFVGATLARCALAWLGEAISVRGGVEAGKTVRDRLVVRLVELGPAYIRRERPGEISSSLTDGIERLQDYFSEYLPKIYLGAVVPLLIGLFVLWLDWPSGIVLIATAPAIPILMVLIGRDTERHARDRWQTFSSMGTRFLTTLRALPMVRSFGAERAEEEKVRRVSEDLRRSTMLVLRRAFFSGLALEFVSTVSVALVAVMLAMRLLYGSMTFEVALLALLLAPEFFRPLREIGAVRHAALEGKAAAARISEMLESPATFSVPENPQPLPSFPFDLEVRGVGYTYPGGERAALSGVGFRLAPGELVALVGESGAGKSTMLDLLMRFSDPSEGEIRIGDIPLHDIHPDLWRSSVAFVGQRPYLVSGTVLENIALAAPDASPTEIREAARSAGAHSFIEGLPEGYETGIGEHGVGLSAGQAQRIAIARALLQDAPALILDEPTSALDALEEETFSRTLAELARDRIVLVVTHRPGPLRYADRVLTLRAGELVHDEVAQDGESPPPDELRPECGQELIVSESNHKRDDVPDRRPGAARSAGVLSRLLGFLVGERRRVALSSALAVWSTGANVALLAVSGYLVALSSLKPPLASLVPAVALVQVLGGSRGFARYGERLLSHDATFGLLSKLRVWLYSRLVPLSPAGLGRRRGGDVLSRLTRDIEEIQNLYLAAVSPLVVAAVVTTAVVVSLGLISSPEVAAVILLSLVAGGVGVPLLSGFLGRGNGLRSASLRSSLGAEVVELLEGMRDLVSSGGAARRVEDISDLGRRLGLSRLRSANLDGLGKALDVLLPGITVVPVVALCAPLVASGGISVVYLPLVALMTLVSFEAVTPLGDGARNLGASLAAGSRVFDLADSEVPVRDRKDALPLGRDAFDLRFEDVSFGYEDGKRILDGVSLCVGGRKKVALVGESGSGKSTIVALILRFHDATSGGITLGGAPIENYRQSDVRGLSSVAFQDAHLTDDGSLRENLLLASPSATEAEMLEALRDSGLGTLVSSLGRGLDEPLGEGGTRLSGGERRRVSIARALLKEAPLLVLDEPSADLDAKSEAVVLGNLLGTDRSLLMCTHRLVGMERFDEILFLKNGRITERGTHSELLASGGEYRSMYEAQERPGARVSRTRHDLNTARYSH